MGAIRTASPIDSVRSLHLQPSFTMNTRVCRRTTSAITCSFEGSPVTRYASCRNVSQLLYSTKISRIWSRVRSGSNILCTQTLLSATHAGIQKLELIRNVRPTDCSQQSIVLTALTVAINVPVDPVAMGFAGCLPSQFKKAETCSDDQRGCPARNSHKREFATCPLLRVSPEQRVVKKGRIQKTQQSQNHQRPCYKHPPPWVPLNKISIAHSFESKIWGSGPC